MSYELADFERQVLQRSQEVPVVVDFWAPWCGPCKSLGPILESMAAAAANRWDLIKVNTEENQDLAADFQISGIPAVKLFRHGRVIDEFVGYKQESQIKAWLEPHLKDPAAAPEAPIPAVDELELAAEMIDEERLQEARTLLDRVLSENPRRHPARLLLAEVLLSGDPADSLAELDKIPAEADEAPHAAALRILADAARRNPSELAEDTVKAQLVAGLDAVKRRDWDAALEAFVEVTERRRKYADGVAAEAGKAIFRYLGIRHPIAEKHYRRFSGALNS